MPIGSAGSGLFWLVLYITPTLIGIVHKVESLALVVILDTVPVAWLAALLAACLMPRRDGRQRREPLVRLASARDAGCADQHVLCPAHRERLWEYNERDHKIRLLTPGIEAAEQIVRDHSA